MAVVAQDRVSNDVFRERFEFLRERGLSAAEVARRLGWEKTRYPGEGRPDATRVERVLGMKPYSSGTVKDYFQLTVSYDLAVQLCDALGLDYFEAGV